MDIGTIAAASLDMSSAKTATAVDIALTKKVMNLQETLAADLLQSLEQAVPTAPPSFGHRLNVLV
jgi:hypothetical protein